MMATLKRSPEYSFRSLIVTDFNVRAGVAVNHELRTRKLCSPNTKVLEHHTELVLSCHNIDPDEPLSDAYSFIVYGNGFPSPDTESTLGDYHVEDEQGIRRYRKGRGVDVPVYDPPKGLAVLSKVGGERAWSSALWLPRNVVSDMVSELYGQKPVYVFVHVRKEKRALWIVGFDLQTANPLD